MLVFGVVPIKFLFTYFSDRHHAPEVELPVSYASHNHQDPCLVALADNRRKREELNLFHGLEAVSPFMTDSQESTPILLKRS